MNCRLYVFANLVILQMDICHGRNWMYSKSWIEDYRTNVKYGWPSQRAPTEYSLETHKIGVIQREEERYLDNGGYDYRESSTVLGTRRNLAVRNKGHRLMGHLVSDLVIVPRNVTHVLPSLRVDMILLDKVSEDIVNFIGLLETPKDESYFSLSSSLRSKKNSSISYEFVLCGNYRRSDMLSIGYMQVHYNTESDLDTSKKLEAAVIDPYFFMVVLKSLALNGTSLATCDELNIHGAIFDNTVPGIYLPLLIYQRFMRAINAYAIRHEFPIEKKIWERRTHVCFESFLNWEDFPEIKVEYFSRENEATQVLYSGQSLVHRYYTEDSGEKTFCYIFAIRKSAGDHVIFGRAAFQGVRLLFNRSGSAVSFLENSCCGPTVQLRRITETKEAMSLCLPKNLRSTMLHLDTHWIWILITGIILAIVACLLSIPRSLNRVYFGPPAIHIFIPGAEILTCEGNCPGKSNTME